ncbi:hypothetical protein EDB19DRAFT_1903614 [Suillus lakei]|nr:hypothetical protein EDB19DRAFT_1903614 [Suillus lakei]
MAPAVTRLVCRFPNCNRVFKNKSGLTQHTHAKHGTPQIQNLNRTAPLAGPGFIPPRSHSPTPAGVIDENIYDDPAGDQGFPPPGQPHLPTCTSFVAVAREILEPSDSPAPDFVDFRD